MSGDWESDAWRLFAGRFPFCCGCLEGIRLQFAEIHFQKSTAEQTNVVDNRTQNDLVAFAYLSDDSTFRTLGQ